MQQCKIKFHNSGFKKYSFHVESYKGKELTVLNEEDWRAKDQIKIWRHIIHNTHVQEVFKNTPTVQIKVFK